MRRLPFVLWLLGSPVIYDLGQLEDSWRGSPWSHDETAALSLGSVIVYVLVARLLWNDESRRARVVSTTTVEVDR